jgi:hypothetical protein
MSLDALRPQNTQNARAVGVNSFKRFLEQENVGLDYVFDCMYNNPDGRCMKAVLEKFALHLAFTVGVKEKMLITNTVMSYFRLVKKWLVELFPQCHAAIEKRLLEVARILESHMTKRVTGTVAKQAPACTKKDLSILVRYLYMHASSVTDYQNAALITMLWYVFGRASDFSLVQKESLSVCSGENFFVRLVRIKTTDQQGLTLYPDEDITTCPILAISIALAMQTAPFSQLLENVRPTPMSLDLEALESLPLMELLMQAEQPLPAPKMPDASVESKPNTEKKKAPAPPGIHNQINRLLGRKRRVYRATRASICRLQAFTRMVLARCHCLKLQVAAVRKFLSRRTFIRARRTTLRLQVRARGFVQRGCRATSASARQERRAGRRKTVTKVVGVIRFHVARIRMRNRTRDMSVAPTDVLHIPGHLRARDRLADQMSLIHVAARNGALDLARFVLEEKSQMEDLVYSKDSAGSTPLHYAARLRHVDMANPLPEIANCNSGLSGSDLRPRAQREAPWTT